MFEYFSNFCVEDPNILPDHCVLNFVLDFELPQCDINQPASNTAEAEVDPHWCRGKYVWDNNKANIFLNNLQSESVHQQLNRINESLK